MFGVTADHVHRSELDWNILKLHTQFTQYCYWLYWLILTQYCYWSSPEVFVKFISKWIKQDCSSSRCIWLYSQCTVSRGGSVTDTSLLSAVNIVNSVMWLMAGIDLGPTPVLNQARCVRTISVTWCLSLAVSRRDSSNVAQSHWMCWFIYVVVRCVFSVYKPCVLMRGVVRVRGTDVYAAHRAARGRRIPSCRSWRSWGWTLAAGWSDAPSRRTDRTPPWRCCDPNTSRAFATSPAGSGTTPGKRTTKYETFKTSPGKQTTVTASCCVCSSVWNETNL